MVGRLEPLPSNQPIVNSDGTPTLAFMRWAQTKQIDLQGAASATLVIATTADELTGGGDLTADREFGLADTAVAPGPYGDATHVAQVTIDQKGRVINAVEVPIAGGSGAYTKIAEVITAASQPAVTFAAIPATYRDLVLRITARSDSVVGNDTKIQLQFNADGAANYDTQQIFAVGAGGLNVGVSGQTSFTGMQISTSNPPATVFDSGDITVGNYNSPVNWKSVFGQSTNTDAAGALRLLIFAGRWRNIAPVTDIALSLASGNFVDGSVVSLYGVA